MARWGIAKERDAVAHARCRSDSKIAVHVDPFNIAYALALAMLIRWAMLIEWAYVLHIGRGFNVRFLRVTSCLLILACYVARGHA